MSHPPNFNPLWRRALGRIGLVTNAELERAEKDLMRTNHNLICAERRLRDQANELTELKRDKYTRDRERRAAPYAKFNEHG